MGHNSANMAPLGFKRAELESYEYQISNSASFNPNGTILAELQADLNGDI